MSHDYEYVQEVVVDEWPSHIIIHSFSDHGREDDQKITAAWNSTLSVTLKRRLEACLAGGAEYSYAASS